MRRRPLCRETGERGYYPIVSITDGTVESLGWLELGGWRVGSAHPGAVIATMPIWIPTRIWKWEIL